MVNLLAYADRGDAGATDLALLVGGVVIVVVIVILAGVLVGMARHRGERRREIIRKLAVIWAILSAGSLIYFGVVRTRWSQEYTTDIESGYFDPRDTTGKPAAPWVIWGGLAIVYIALAGWTLSGRRDSGK